MEGEKKTRANAPCLERRQRKDRAWVIQSAMRGTAPLWNPRSFQLHTRRRNYCGCIKKSRAGSKKVSLRLVSVSSVQSLSRVRLFVTPWTAARQASLSITNSWNLLKLMSIELVMPSKHLILCHPLLLPPSVFLSIRVFCNQLVLCIRWPKYWSFSFSISPSNEYSGLISFKIDWFDLLAVQGLSRVFSSITVQKHQFFSAQLSLPTVWERSVSLSMKGLSYLFFSHYIQTNPDKWKQKCSYHLLSSLRMCIWCFLFPVPKNEGCC